MSANLELLRKKTDRKRVECARDEQILKIAEREEEIERIREQIKIQEHRMTEMDAEIAAMKTNENN